MDKAGNDFSIICTDVIKSTMYGRQVAEGFDSFVISDPAIHSLIPGRFIVVVLYMHRMNIRLVIVLPFLRDAKLHTRRIRIPSLEFWALYQRCIL